MSHALEWIRHRKKLSAFIAAVGLWLVVMLPFEVTAWNAVTELWGVAGGGLVVWALLENQRRTRLRGVELYVLEGALAQTIAIVRHVGIFAAANEQAVSMDEDSEDAVRRAEAFAKRVRHDGVNLPPLTLENTAQISRLLDDTTAHLLALQSNYSFVFVEYPDVAQRLIELMAKRTSLKSAFYWHEFHPDRERLGDELQRRAEQKMNGLVTTCDDLAEILSRHVDELRLAA